MDRVMMLTNLNPKKIDEGNWLQSGEPWAERVSLKACGFSGNCRDFSMVCKNDG